MRRAKVGRGGDGEQRFYALQIRYSAWYLYWPAAGSERKPGLNFGLGRCCKLEQE